MIEEFDRLAITSDNMHKLTKKEQIERVKKRDALIKQMNEEEIEELLKRPYPVQYKIKIKNLSEKSKK